MFVQRDLFLIPQIYAMETNHTKRSKSIVLISQGDGRCFSYNHDIVFWKVEGWPTQHLKQLFIHLKLFKFVEKSIDLFITVIKGKQTAATNCG